MSKGHNYQASHIINSSNRVSGNIYQAAANTKEYFSLRTENELLAAENTALKNLLKQNFILTKQNPKKDENTERKRQYYYLNAKVINATVNSRTNYLTINIGASSGVTRDMAVYSSEGLVGIVKDVSNHFASVMSILHKDTRINCMLKKDGSFGPLIWDGEDYRYCLLTDIPTHAKIKEGDTVITSHLSGIFPEGIMVGVVEEFEKKQNEPFYTARVKLNIDFKKVNHVYVVSNKFKQEKDSLEQISQIHDDK